MIVSMIVAAAENNVIGRDNRMIWHLSGDMKHFKTLTTGHAVIMGRKTYESLGRPLPERKNIVLTQNPDFTAKGCTCVHTLEEALKTANHDNEVFIIGGSTLYKEFWNTADKLYLTRIHANVEGDAFLSPVSAEDWKEEERIFHPADDKNEYDYSFITYIRNKSLIIPSETKMPSCVNLK
ncbi:Dihydrofolate reductase [termite gut metagenome]|uniref:dihydrofolate reductase n=1 Tax=termite gut metagenome TaxID=433724 RepID=A0A5J4R3P6_9ZZZZ